MLRYRLLGPLAVQRDGRDLDLGPPKQRAVLAVLAQQPGVTVSIDRLLDAVWGDHHPASVSASLHSYVSRLRRILRPEAGAPSPVVRGSGGYLLDADPDTFDVTEFLAACRSARSAVEGSDWAAGVASGQQALDLWRGAYLADLADESWVQVAAVPLLEHRQGVVQDLVVALLGIGDLPTALARAATMSAEQPLVERAAWLHAVCLHRAGRTPEALALHDAFRRSLADELGLDLGPALRDLHAALLRQDPALHAWPGPARRPAARDAAVPSASPATAADAPGGDTGSAEPASRTSSPPLVGREEQLATLDAVLATARVAGPAWVVLTGEPGIGKTRLAQEAAHRWAAAGGRVVRVSCPDVESLPTWWVLGELLHPLGLDPAAILAAPEGTDADSVQLTVLGQVRQALATALEKGPLLALVDDVHWADAGSLGALAFLAETVEAPGLVVVLTARSGGTSAGLERLLAAVARRPGARVAVPPLQEDELAELVAQVGGGRVAAGDVADLAVRSGGNPFFAGELARLDPAERARGVTPAAVSAVLRRRLAALPADQQEVLSVAAVLGDPLDVPLLARIAGRDVDDVGDLLDEAADRDLLAPSIAGPTYAFAHALLRDEVLRALPATHRRRLHLRAADELRGHGGAGTAVRRAAHLRAAGPLANPRDTYTAARRVAVDADRDQQPDMAATWWDAALEAFERLPEQDPGERRGLVLGRVGALTRAGRGQAVLDALDAGVVQALREGRTGDAGRLAAHLVRVSGSWPWPVYGSDPAPLLGTLRAVVPRLADDRGAQARVLAAAAIGHCYDPDPDVPDTMSGRAVELAESTGDADVLADALLGRAMTYAGVARRAEESIALLARVPGLGHALAELDDVLVGNVLTMAHLALGDVAACAAAVEAAAVGSDLLRLQLNRVQLRWAEAAMALWQGDLQRAERLYARAELSHRQTELQQAGTFELAELVLRWEQGRLAEVAGQVPSNAGVSAWTSAVAGAASGAVGCDDALAREVHRDEPEVWTSHGRLTFLAHAVADRRLGALAGPMRTRLEPFSGYLANLGQCGVAGPVDLALARLCDLQGDRPLARAHLERAGQQARRAGGASAALRCRLLLATWAADDGTSSPGDLDELRAVRSEAASRGMLGLVRAADALADVVR